MLIVMMITDKYDNDNEDNVNGKDDDDEYDNDDDETKCISSPYSQNNRSDENGEE